MSCYECGWSRISRTRDGHRVCPRCGAAEAPSHHKEEAGEQPTGVVKAYTGFFAVFGLLFPFLIPIILKVSYLYS